MAVSSDVSAGAEPVRHLGKLRHRGRHILGLRAFGHSDGKNGFKAKCLGTKGTKIAWAEQPFQCRIFFIAIITI